MTCKELKDFLCLKISLEESMEEGVQRDHEEGEEEGEKKARGKLCTVLSSHPELEWFGWEGGKTMNRKRAVACFQDAATEDDFQKLFVWKK